MLEGRRVALVHDWLTGMRGGEKCLEVLCELFPDATLFTLLHEKGRVSETIEEMRIRTSFIQYMPGGLKHYRHFLPLFPKAIEQFDLRSFELIVSSSHCVAKGVKPGPESYHFSYVHAPMRYVWDAFDTYFRRPGTSWQTRVAAETVRPYLQRWDQESAERVHTFVCNSRNIRSKIRDCYEREAEVIHAPVDLDRFQPGSQKSDYFLMVGAFAPNKRVDLAMEVFNRLQLPLKIVGSGQDEESLHALAGPSIEFLGERSDGELVNLFQQARAFLFPGEDDFGITPLEAQACGTPVVAYAAGGATETVTEQTGILFLHPNQESLSAAVAEMEVRHNSFSQDDLTSHVKRFGRERFKNRIAAAIESGYQQWHARREAQAQLSAA